MIPKQTTPLTKSIRTLEGILVTVSNVAVVATSAVDPTTLPPKYASIVVATQNVALLVSRAIVKAKASTVLNDVIDGDLTAVVSDFNPDFAGAPEPEDA